jgi:hypothetical protein
VPFGENDEPFITPGGGAGGAAPAPGVDGLGLASPKIEDQLFER